MPSEPYVWVEPWVSRLEELVNEGYLAEDIAVKLTLEMGREITRQAVYLKANEEGLALRGRAPPPDSPYSLYNPFSEPDWLKTELSKQFKPPEPPRRFANFYMPHDPELRPTFDKLVKHWEKQALMSSWCQYVNKIMDEGSASPEMAFEAKQAVPRWFSVWAQPLSVTWDWLMLDFQSIELYRTRVQDIIDHAPEQDRDELSRLLDDEMFIPEPESETPGFIVPSPSTPEPVEDPKYSVEAVKPEAEPVCNGMPVLWVSKREEAPEIVDVEPVQVVEPISDPIPTTAVVEEKPVKPITVDDLPAGVRFLDEVETFTSRLGTHKVWVLRVSRSGGGSMIQGVSSRIVRVPRKDLRKWCKEYVANKRVSKKGD